MFASAAGRRPGPDLVKIRGQWNYKDLFKQTVQHSGYSFINFPDDENAVSRGLPSLSISYISQFKKASDPLLIQSYEDTTFSV
jgi:hypothetical protein